MMNGNTLTPQPGSARSLGSVEAAEEYLARHPHPEFIAELRAWWGDHLSHPPDDPRSRGEVQAFLLHARKAVRAAGLRRGGATREALERTAFHLVQERDSFARPLRRRLASEPKAARLALLVANVSFGFGGIEDRDEYVVTGALAAPLAVALGVERPTPWGATGERAVKCVKKWERKMALARSYIGRLRADERSDLHS